MTRGAGASATVGPLAPPTMAEAPPRAHIASAVFGCLAAHDLKETSLGFGTHRYRKYMSCRALPEGAWTPLCRSAAEVGRLWAFKGDSRYSYFGQ